MAIYDNIGLTYAEFRRPDERIAAAIASALGDATSVVNVGAGTGSYEPIDRDVIAVEPSEVMIRQRPVGAAPCLQASAEELPLESGSVDAAMAVLTVHHWTDFARGLSEMARVARKRIVVLTWVPDSPPFWLTRDYFPEITTNDVGIFPTSDKLLAKVEQAIGRASISTVPVPHDCTDGFLGAFWRRPEAYLSAGVRSAMSCFAKFDAEPGLTKLRADLLSGRWAEGNAELLGLEALDLGYRILCCELVPGARTGATEPGPIQPPQNQRPTHR